MLAAQLERAFGGLRFLRAEHRAYVESMDSRRDTLEQAAIEHLRMSGVYWTVSAASILGAMDVLDGPAIVDFVLTCRHANGGFAGNVGHRPHLLYTLSAVQLLAIYGALDRIDADATAAFVASLQQPDGSFAGDEWGEVDTRFSYCALCTCAILGKLDALDVSASNAFVASCASFDGSLGAVPGAEAHAGQVFCCVGALSIGHGLDALAADELGWWLCERQCDSGGLNGRPEKQADVCYSWWVLTGLVVLGRDGWIDRSALVRFILDCQDPDAGGIADRPGDMADIYHTYFGLAGLSMLGYLGLQAEAMREAGADAPAFEPVDPVFALPQRVVDRLGLRAQRLPRVPHLDTDGSAAAAPTPAEALREWVGTHGGSADVDTGDAATGGAAPAAAITTGGAGE